MADRSIPLSPISDNFDQESSDHSPQRISSIPAVGVAIGSSCVTTIRKEPATTTTSSAHRLHTGGAGSGGEPSYDPISPVSKKPRGRPPGSKNKPKPPIIVTRENDQSLKPVVLEISAGFDVVESVIEFARRWKVGICILSGSGSVSDVSLCNPNNPHSPSCTLHGPFKLMSLFGTYIGGSFPASPPLTSASPSSSSQNPSCGIAFSGCSSFGITFAGAQGHIYGGVISGKILAAGVVTVVATIFKNPEIHRLRSVENEEDGGGIRSSGGGIGKGSGGGGGGNGGNDNVVLPSAVFGNVASPSALNCVVPGDVMQWGNNVTRGGPSY